MQNRKTKRIFLLGNVSAGKTTILNLFAKRKMPEKVSKTISPAYQTVDELQIWDIPGEKKFRAEVSSNYPKVDAFIFVIDPYDLNQFEQLDAILSEVSKINRDSPKLIVINYKTPRDNFDAKPSIDLIKQKHGISQVFEVNKIDNPTSLNSVLGQIDAIFNEATKELKQKEAEILQLNQNNKSQKPISDLKANLTAYINDSNNRPVRFPFFKKSQIENRKANCLLATEIIKKLDNNESLDSVMQDINKQRTQLAKQHGLFKTRFSNHGINSSQLNNALRQAEHMVRQQRSR